MFAPGYHAEMAAPLCLCEEVLVVEPALSPCTLCLLHCRPSTPALGRQGVSPYWAWPSAAPTMPWEVFPLRLPLVTEVSQHELGMVL